MIMMPMTLLMVMAMLMAMIMAMMMVKNNDDGCDKNENGRNLVDNDEKVSVLIMSQRHDSI